MLRPHPDHPGKILADRFCAPARLAPSTLALDLRVPPNRLTRIVNGQRGITVDTALRLARYFGNRPEDWLTWQMEWELAEARDTGREHAISQEVRPRAARQAA